MKSYCIDCGCAVYSGHCVNCHEETYIAEQDAGNDEHIVFSEEFNAELSKQEKEAANLNKIYEQRQHANSENKKSD